MLSTTAGTAMSSARPAKNATMAVVNITLAIPVPITTVPIHLLCSPGNWPVNRPVAM